MNAVAVHTITKRSWLRTLSSRFAPPPPDSALVRSVIARGRETLNGVVVLSPMPQLWSMFDDDEDEEDEDTDFDLQSPWNKNDLG